MAGINRVILVGHLGKDPELRYTPSGQAVANFSIATTETWNDKQGQRQERTEWHRLVVWGKQAELCGQYLAKGRMVYVEGKLQTREWNDRDGNKRTTTEIITDRVVFLSSKGDGSNLSSNGNRANIPGGMAEMGAGNLPPLGGASGMAPMTTGSGSEMDFGGPPPLEDDVPF